MSIYHYHLTPQSSVFDPSVLNDTKQALVIIEAQVGSYTGEDDIERLDDDFKRN